MCDKFKLYVIYSNRNLNDIMQLFMNSTKKPLEIGPLRKDFMRNIETGEYRETNIRYIILSDDVFEDLKTAGLSDENNEEFFIEEFNILKEYEAPKDCIKHFYFPYSNDNKDSIMNKLSDIQKLGFIQRSDYFVHNGVVEFSNSITYYHKIIIKIILDNVECRVSWCRMNVFNKIKRKFK